ncbi:PP0621 family protein [Aquabacterium sp. J223]|uniref:PP0621 family protein n=1 Tax=Aquabacterium sp. J223 TaxID=2898431 RepID=UPI0021ADC790|nr:PP0621 family protein [Aquabacterium sp. J223]UUX95729.1 hypothetical protein LRS07_21480 [Aquabacterium sp. J223]
MKYLIWVLVIGLLWWWWTVKARGPRTPPPRSQPADRAAAPSGPQPMVRCAYCGLHLPRNEALPPPPAVDAGVGAQTERLYCSEAHRAADAGR